MISKRAKFYAELIKTFAVFILGLIIGFYCTWFAISKELKTEEIVTSILTIEVAIGFGYIFYIILVRAVTESKPESGTADH